MVAKRAGVAVAGEEHPRPAPDLSNNASPTAIRGGRPGAPRLGRDRSERMARPPASIRASAPVALQATQVGSDIILQSQSSRPGVRMRRGAAMDDGRLLPSRQRRGRASDSAKRSNLPCVRHYNSLEVSSSDRLYCCKRMSGVADVSYGSAAGSRPFSSARRLNVKGRHSRCVLPPPPTQGRSALPIFQRRGSGLCAVLPELRSSGGALVLYEGNETSGRLSTRKRPPRFLLPRRLLWAGATTRGDQPATENDTGRVGMEMRSLFARLGFSLHPTKCDFTGARSLEI
jgi:hypothetical protein